MFVFIYTLTQYFSHLDVDKKCLYGFTSSHLLLLNFFPHLDVDRKSANDFIDDILASDQIDEGVGQNAVDPREQIEDGQSVCGFEELLKEVLKLFELLISDFELNTCENVKENARFILLIDPYSQKPRLSTTIIIQGCRGEY